MPHGDKQTQHWSPASNRMTVNSHVCLWWMLIKLCRGQKVKEVVCGLFHPSLQYIITKQETTYHVLGRKAHFVFLFTPSFAHLDKPLGTVRVMITFSSNAFDTISLALLPHWCRGCWTIWLVRVLTGLFVWQRHQHGAPQGTIASPLLFTLYTAERPATFKSFLMTL